MSKLVALVILVFVFGLVAVALRTRRGRGRASRPTEGDESPYEKRRYLLTKAEKSFYLVLHQALPEGYVIFPKVRVVDVLNVRGGQGNRQGHLNRISAKHFDFLICDRQWLEPRLAIELDDRSHERPARETRDEFLDDAARGAGLPLLRVRAQAAYDTHTLQGDLARRLSGEQRDDGGAVRARQDRANST